MRALLIATVLTILLIGLVNSASHEHHNRHGHKSRHNHPKKHETKHHPMTRTQHHALRQSGSPGNNATVEVCSVSCTKNLTLAEAGSWVFNVYGTGEVIIYFCAKSNAVLVFNTSLKIVVVFIKESKTAVILNLGAGKYLVVKGGLAVYGSLQASAGLSYDLVISLAVDVAGKANFSFSFKISAIGSTNLADFNGNLQLQVAVNAAFGILVVSGEFGLSIVTSVDFKLYVRIFGAVLSAAAVIAATVLAVVFGAVVLLSAALLNQLLFVTSIVGFVIYGVVTILKIIDLKLFVTLVRDGTSSLLTATVDGIVALNNKVLGFVGDVVGGLVFAVGGVLGLAGSILSQIGSFIQGSASGSVTVSGGGSVGATAGVSGSASGGGLLNIFG